VPTVGETLPGYRADAFQAWSFPPASRGHRQQLSTEVARIVKLPDVTQRFQLDGAEAVGSTPQEFATF